jgi:probable phosphoglycerate mutase
LTPEGEAQARALARRLAREDLHEIQTSPRERARSTAEAIAAATGAPLATQDALDEIDFGDWTGAAFADLDGQPLWDDWNRARSTARPPGGESMAEAADRIERHVQALAATRAGQRVALVTHADMIRALVARVLGLSLDNLLRFEIGPASVTVLEIGPHGARLLSLNETTDMAA